MSTTRTEALSPESAHVGEVTDIEAAPTTILFATDGTVASKNARGAAAHLARASQAALHIVHVWASTTTIGSRRGVDEEIATGVATAEARRMEEELGCRVAGVHTPYGSRAHGILATAGAVGAGLIVVGGRQLGIVEELFTYRVSEAVVQQSLRPVLLVREDGDAWPPRHIIVGCDGSPEAVRAAALASWIARLADADLALVAVVDADAPASEEATRNAQRALEISAASVGAQRGEVRTTTRVVERTDVPAALREACTSTAGPRLLALGARGSSSLYRNPGFSVSRSVTHHTHLPLLLVPPLHTGLSSCHAEGSG